MGANTSRISNRNDVMIDSGGLFPNGIYQTTDKDYDTKTLQSLILKRKISPFYKGLHDEPEIPSPSNSLYDHAIECPICFLYYPANINYTRCCNQPICTECFIQISENCPYCTVDNFGVLYRIPSWSEKYQASVNPEIVPIGRIRSKKVPKPTIPSRDGSVHTRETNFLEDYMMLEAIRLSLIEQEEFQKKQKTLKKKDEDSHHNLATNTTTV